MEQVAAWRVDGRLYTDEAKAKRAEAAGAEAITERASNIAMNEKLCALLTPRDGLCRLCGGSGHLLCYQDGQREFWPCPACGGVGSRVLYSAPTIHTHAR